MENISYLSMRRKYYSGVCAIIITRKAFEFGFPPDELTAKSSTESNRKSGVPMSVIGVGR